MENTYIFFLTLHYTQLKQNQTDNLLFYHMITYYINNKRNTLSRCKAIEYVVEYLNLLITLSSIRNKQSFQISSNFEATASGLLEDLEEIFLCYLQLQVSHEQITRIYYQHPCLHIARDCTYVISIQHLEDKNTDTTATYTQYYSHSNSAQVAPTQL